MVIINRAYAMFAGAVSSISDWLGNFPRAERCRKVSAADGGHGKKIVERRAVSSGLHRDDQPSTLLLENGEPRFCGHHM